MTPSQSICIAVRDLIRTKHGENYCHGRADGTPRPTSGEYFIAVFAAVRGHGGSADQHLGIDRTIGVGIGITKRTGLVPEDRMFSKGAYTKTGVVALYEQIDDLIRANRYLLNGTATELVGAGAFVEPLRLQGSNLKVRKVGPDHFHAPPCGKNCNHQNCASGPKHYGLYLELNYLGRYMRGVQSFGSGFSNQFA